MRREKRYWRILLKPCDNWEKAAEVDETKSDIMRIPVLSMLKKATMETSEANP